MSQFVLIRQIAAKAASRAGETKPTPTDTIEVNLNKFTPTDAYGIRPGAIK